MRKTAKFWRILLAFVIIVAVLPAALADDEPFAITLQPVDKIAEEGENVIFAVAASGGIVPYSYQWQIVNEGGSVTNISGATSASLSLTNVQLADSGTRYRCVLWDAESGSIPSNVATLTVNAAGSFAIITQPQNVVVREGENAVFTVEASGGSAPYIYQWEKRIGINHPWVPISGATESVLTLENVHKADENSAYRCVVTSGTGIILTSSNALLSVLTGFPPTIITHPQSQTVTQGESVTFTVEATGGTPPYTYQWEKRFVGESDWIEILGAESSSFTIDNAQYGDYAQYRCAVTGVFGPTVYSGTGLLNVSALGSFVISTQPQPQTVIEGESATFTVVASGGFTPYTYQWYKIVDLNPVPIPGAIASSITLTNLQPADSTNINCRVTALDGSIINSNYVMLTVNERPPLMIISHPQSVVAQEDGDVSFSVTVGGGYTPYTYRWQISTDAGSTWSYIPGAIWHIFSVENVTPDVSGNQYRCVIEDGNYNFITSNAATLYMNESLIIDTHPQNQTATAGQNVTFSVMASGGNGISYQWQRNDGNGWKDINGATGANLYLISVRIADNDSQYRCLVTDDNFDAAISNAATLTVNPQFLIATQPQNQSAVEGNEAIFQVLVTGTVFHAQWQKNDGNGWTDIHGATNLLLTVSNLQMGDNGSQYRCVLSDVNYDSVTSATATLTVIPLLTINVQPQDQTVNTGDSVTFSVVASGGTGTLNYQWQIFAGDYINIPGETTESLTLTDVQLANHNKSYRCVVTDSAADPQISYSDYATLTVLEPPPLIISTHPADQSVPEGGTATFSVVASGGTGTLNYQWQIFAGDFVNIPGETSASLTLTNVQLADDNKSYRCVVTDSAAEPQISYSDDATLTVLAPPPLIISTHPADQTVPAGAIATFSVAASGGTGTLNYQWQKNNGNGWTDIPGETSASLVLIEVGHSDNSSRYRCMVTDSAQTPVTITSNSATLEVTEQELTVMTNVASGMTSSGAILSGNVVAAHSEYVTARGFVYSINANPVIGEAGVTQVEVGAGTGNFTAMVSGLLPGTTYHVRAYAEFFAESIDYGANITFTTAAIIVVPPVLEEFIPPTVETNAVSSVTTSGATLFGHVTSDGGAAVSERGFVYGTTANPTIGSMGVTKVQVGSGMGDFTTVLKNLAPDTTYFVRAYAINSQGASYGATVSCITLAVDDQYEGEELPKTGTAYALRAGISILLLLGGMFLLKRRQKKESGKPIGT